MLELGTENAHDARRRPLGKGTLMRIGVGFCLGIGMTALATAPVHAIPFNLEVFADGAQIGDVDESELGCVDTVPGEAAQCTATGLEYGPSYTALTIEDLDFQIDNDPVVNGSMTVTNSQNFTQHFTL